MFKGRALIQVLAVAALGVVFGALVYVFASPSPPAKREGMPPRLDVSKSLSARQEVKLAGLDASPRSVVFANVGDSVTLTARGYYSDRSFDKLNGKATYESTNPAVVSVTANGIVTAQAEGAADIVARHGEFSVAVPVIVYGEMRMPPPVDPAMVGIVPAIDPETPVVLNRVMVELLPGYGLADAQALAASIGGDVVFSYRTFPGHIIEFDPSTRELDAALSAMESEPTVEAAHVDAVVEFSNHPTDTFPGGGRVPAGTAPYREVGFQRAWEMMERIDDLDPVNIAVIDSGFQDPAALSDQKLRRVLQSEFPQISITPSLFLFDVPTDSNGGRVIVTYLEKNQIEDPDFTSHGTGVASVIAAANNKEDDPNHKSELSGVVSSVPNLRYNLHVLSIGIPASSGSARPSYDHLTDHLTVLSQVIASLENIESRKAVFDVVNMSFGYKESDGDKPREFARDVMPGVTFVVAAGNCEEDASQSSPSDWSLDMPNAITVGGTNGNHSDRWRKAVAGGRCGKRNLGSGSAFGPPVSEYGVAAPAERVLVVTPKGSGFTRLSGTSGAAPMVTGTVALLKAISPDLQPEEIRQILRDSADKKPICTSNNNIASCPPKEVEEWSFLRADKAVHELLKRLVKAEIVEPPPPLTTVGPFITVFSTVEATVLNTGERNWTFYVEAWARSPSGDEFPLGTVETAIPPGKTHPITWWFHHGGVAPTERGVWDLKIVVRRDDIDDPDMDLALPPRERELALSDWGEAKIEVLSLTTPEPASISTPTPPPVPTKTPTPPPAPTKTPTPEPSQTRERPYKIAFMSNRDGNREIYNRSIYTAEADGGNVQRLTFTSFDESPSDWSPDGSKISYTLVEREIDGSAKRTRIYTVNADGSDPKPIRDEWSTRPAFSPSGREVVFASSSGTGVGGVNLYAIRTDGSNLRQLTFNKYNPFVYYPDWSPNGDQIAYTALRDGYMHMFLLDMQTGQEEKLMSVDTHDASPVFSPDGKEIAYHNITPAHPYTALFVLNLETRETRQIIKDACCADWSPDGKFIYFRMDDPGGKGKGIYRISPNGGSPEVIIPDTFYYNVRVVVSPFLD